MTTIQRAYVLGAGGHAKVVIQLLRSLGYHILAVFDDDVTKWRHELLGICVKGRIDDVRALPRFPCVIAVGDNNIRAAIAARLDVDWLTVVHPCAVVDWTVSLGLGTVVLAGAVVQVDTQIGMHVIVNTSASIDHDCVLEDFVHIAPGVRLAGGVRIGRHALLGIGSAVIPERCIGADTTIGAGAVVTSDVPADVVAVGVPARIATTRQNAE